MGLAEWSTMGDPPQSLWTLDPHSYRLITRKSLISLHCPLGIRFTWSLLEVDTHRSDRHTEQTLRKIKGPRQIKGVV